MWRRTLLIVVLLLLVKRIKGGVHRIIKDKAKEAKLKASDSAFDEIQQFNAELDLEHNHPPGVHIVEGDILEDDDSFFQIGDSKQTGTGVKITNNYYEHTVPTFNHPTAILDHFIKKELQKNKEAETGEKRGVIKNEMRLWRTRTIPYVIAPSREDVTIEIENGIREISSQSCLRFVKRTTEKDYITFDKQKGCLSKLGQQGGEQFISIGNGCERKEVVTHEILHSLGFYHEQNRYDRDDFVDILWNNIETDKLSQMKKYSRDEMDELNLPYDLKSVMHYGKTAFSKNGLPTVLSKKHPDLELGNTDGLSPGDVDEIKQLYKCDDLPIGGFGKWNNLPCYDNLVRLKYRICYGQDDSICEGHGMSNGLQVMRETCDEFSVKAYMEGCFNQQSRNKLPFQRRASQLACATMKRFHNPLNPTNEAYVRAYRVCALLAYAKKFKKFGITNYCHCWFGDDDVNILENGVSSNCKDGTGFNQGIFLYIIEYRDDNKI